MFVTYDVPTGQIPNWIVDTFYVKLIITTTILYQQFLLIVHDSIFRHIIVTWGLIQGRKHCPGMVSFRYHISVCMCALVKILPKNQKRQNKQFWQQYFEEQKQSKENETKKGGLILFNHVRIRKNDEN